MNNHDDTLGNRDIGNLALKLTVGVIVAKILSSVDQGRGGGMTEAHSLSSNPNTTT